MATPQDADGLTYDHDEPQATGIQTTRAGYRPGSRMSQSQSTTSGAFSHAWQSRRIYGPLLFLVLLSSAASAASLTVVALFARDELGASEVMVTVYFAAAASGGCLAMVAVGRVSDRIRNRAVVIWLALAWLGTGYFVLAEVRSVATLLAIGVAFMSVLNVANSQLLAYARDTLVHRPSNVVSSTSMVSLVRQVFSCGSLLGFGSGGVAMASFGVRPVFQAAGVAYLACAAVSLLTVRSPTTARQGVTLKPSGGALRPVLAATAQPDPLRLVVLFAALMVLFASGRVMQVAHLPIVASQLGMSVTGIGLLLAVPPCAEIVLMPIVARVAHRWGRANVFLLGGAASILYYCGLALVRSPWQLLPLQVCNAVFGAAAVMVGIDLAQRLMENRQGTATSSYLSHENLAVVSGSAVAMVSVGTLGNQIGFLVPAGLCLVAFSLVVALFARHPTAFDLRGDGLRTSERRLRAMLRRADLRRWLYLDTYTQTPDRQQDTPSSDSIGYGITSSGAIRQELARRGISVVRPDVPIGDESGGGRYYRARWASDVYRRAVDEIHRSRPDLIFVFHVFSTSPALLRKSLRDLDLEIPIVGYTHGSHWDRTDTFRLDRYPGLELLDLANLHSLDRLLVVSEYMRRTLQASIGELSAELAEEILGRTAVVGLPIDTELIEQYRTSRRFSRLTIVFNHAPVLSKGPDVFARVAERILRRYDVNLIVTRRFDRNAPGGRAIAELAARFHDRMTLGNDMALDEYYQTLWMSDIQISTATHESLGVATLEAMYTENCCLLPRIGAYPEICGDNSAALYQPGEDELTKRLAHLIEHPSERRMSSRDLARRAQRYCAETVVDRILHALPDSPGWYPSAGS